MVGVAAATAFCPRQYAPTSTIVSIQTSPSDCACAMLPVTTEMSIGAYQFAVVGMIV